MKKTLSKFIKNTKSILSIILFVFLFFGFNNTKAQAQTQSEVLYQNYVNLFQGSTLRYHAPLRQMDVGISGGTSQNPISNSLFSSKLSGFWMVFNWQARGSNNSEIEKFWSYIKKPSSVLNNTFLLEACPKMNTVVGVQVDANCIYSIVPYEEEPSAEAWTRTLKVVNQFNALLESAFTPSANYFRAIALPFYTSQENSQRRTLQDKVITIFQKGADKNYITNQEIDIVAASWFTMNNGATSPVTIDNSILGTDPFNVSLWYCAEQVNGEPSITNAASTSDGSTRIKKFNTFSSCTYFKVAETTITPPQDIRQLEEDSQNGVAGSTGPANSENTQTNIASETNLPICSISITGYGETKILGCVARIVYYGFYIPTTWLASLFGIIFDFFIGYSVDDASYRYEFVVKGWRIVRDVSNIAFIIILLYTGIKAVFNTDGSAGSDMRRIVPNLIINALIINFSLFATRAVIDASNITTRVFYSRMVVCNGPCENMENGIPSNIRRGYGGYWPLSEKIVSSFDPQKLFSKEVLKPNAEVQNENSGSNYNDPFNSTSAGVQLDQGRRIGAADTGSDEYAGWYILVSLLSGIVMLAIAVMFFKTAFLFVGRVVGLYVLMIFSPVAFLTRSLGKGFQIKSFNWTEWLRELTSYAILAPIFTFFLYIIYSFFESDLVKQMGLKEQGDSFFEILMSIALPMLVIFMLIKYAQKTAEKYSGEIGKMVQGFAEKTIGGAGMVAGGAVGLAAGGAALLGTRLGSSAIKLGANKTGLTKWAAENASTNRFARSLNSGLRSTQTGSWDVRNTWLGKNTGKGINNMISMTNRAGLTNIDPIRDNLSGKLGLGASAFAGGAIALQKKADERKEKALNKKFNDNSFAHLTDDQAKEVWVKIKDEKINEELNKKEKEILNQKIRSNDTQYQGVQKYIEERERDKKIQEDGIKNLKEAIQNGNLSDKEKSESEKEIEKKSKELEKINSSIQESEDKKEQIFNNRLNDQAYTKAIMDTKEYKEEISKEKTSIEKDIDKKYGEVKKTKDLVMAAKMDYMNNQKENSMWMKEQKQRFQVVGGSTPYLGASSGVSALSAALAGSTALASIGGGLAVGGVITSLIKEKVQATDNATKKIIKDLEKQIAKKDSLPKSEADLKNINEKIKNLLGEDIDLMSEETIREKMKLITEDLQANLDIAQINFEKAKKEYMSGSGRVSNDDIKNLSKDQQRARDQVNESSDLLKRRKTLQAQIEKAEGTKNTDSKPKENSDDKSK